jgi:hypothetical protein
MPKNPLPCPLPEYGSTVFDPEAQTRRELAEVRERE